MNKRGFIYRLIFLFLIIFCICNTHLKADAKKPKNIAVSNKYFSVILPYEVKGLYKVSKQKNGIFIYDKEAKKAGFGGFAFGIKSYKNPSDHAVMPGSRKIGELTDKKGKLYDMVLLQPTDVQYDYTKGENPSYHILYTLGELVNIEGVKGSKYFKNQGMKGEDLYQDVLKKHVKAIKEKWDSNTLEKENMSYMYNVLNSENALDKIGYAFYDVNADGIDELFIGEILKDGWKGVVYDIYTIVDRKPAHVVSGGSRDRYFVSNDVFLCNEYSSGAMESGWLIYILVENSTELFPQVGFKFDGYTNLKKPWFLSYNFPKEEWENVDKKKFEERKAVFNRYKRFDYIPLSKVKY